MAEGLPLAGTRVLELTTVIAGPATGGLLADWGADVVRVEPPGGDGFRQMYKGVPGLEASAPSQLSPGFYVDNRSKRAAELDLRQPDAFDAFHKLLARSDVFVSNYRLAALARLQLDPETLRQLYPRLVIAVISGYGSTGPEKDTAGYDMAAFWARSGAADSFRPEAQEFSSLIPGGFGDHTTALAAAGGIAAALVKAAKTGEGSVVETSLLRTGIYANSCAPLSPSPLPLFPWPVSLTWLLPDVQGRSRTRWQMEGRTCRAGSIRSKGPSPL